MQGKIALILLFVVSSYLTKAQNPVQWTYSSKRINDSTFEIHILAKIDPGWHIYAQKQSENGIGIPTTITFTKSPLFQFVGETKEKGNLHIYKDPTLGIVNNQYEDDVDFIQIVKKKGKFQTHVTGSIKFQVCTERQCLFPAEVSFSIPN